MTTTRANKRTLNDVDISTDSTDSSSIPLDSPSPKRARIELLEVATSTMTVAAADSNPPSDTVGTQRESELTLDQRKTVDVQCPEVLDLSSVPFPMSVVEAPPELPPLVGIESTTRMTQTAENTKHIDIQHPITAVDSKPPASTLIAASSETILPPLASASTNSEEAEAAPQQEQETTGMGTTDGMVPQHQLLELPLQDSTITPLVSDVVVTESETPLAESKVEFESPSVSHKIILDHTSRTQQQIQIPMHELSTRQSRASFTFPSNPSDRVSESVPAAADTRDSRVWGEMRQQIDMSVEELIRTNLFDLQWRSDGTLDPEFEEALRKYQPDVNYFHFEWSRDPRSRSVEEWRNTVEQMLKGPILEHMQKLHATTMRASNTIRAEMDFFRDHAVQAMLDSTEQLHRDTTDRVQCVLNHQAMIHEGRAQLEETVQMFQNWAAGMLSRRRVSDS